MLEELSIRLDGIATIAPNVVNAAAIPIFFVDSALIIYGEKRRGRWGGGWYLGVGWTGRRGRVNAAAVCRMGGLGAELDGAKGSRKVFVHGTSWNKYDEDAS